MLTLRLELRLTALFSQPSYFYEEPLPPLPVDIISRHRCTIPCHVNILYCFKERFFCGVYGNRTHLPVSIHPPILLLIPLPLRITLPHILGLLASNILSVSSNSLW